MTTLINLAKQRATELDHEQKQVKLDYNANIYQGDIVSYYNALNHGKIQQHANSIPNIDNHKRTYNSEYLQLQYQPNSGKTDLMRKQLLEGRMSQISGQYNIPTAQEPNLSLGSNSPIVNELDKILNNFVEKVSSGIFDVTMTSDLYAILKIIENEGYKFGRDLLERYKSFFEDIIDLLNEDTTTDFIEGIKNEKSVSQLMSNVTGRCIDIIDAMLEAVKSGNSSTERKLILDAYIKNNILKQTKDDKLKFMKQINIDLKRKETELKKAKKEKNDKVVALLEEQVKLLKEIKFNSLDAMDKFKSTIPTQPLLEDQPFIEAEPMEAPNYEDMFRRDEEEQIIKNREEVKSSIQKSKADFEERKRKAELTRLKVAEQRLQEKYHKTVEDNVAPLGMTKDEIIEAYTFYEDNYDKPDNPSNIKQSIRRIQRNANLIALIRELNVISTDYFDAVAAREEFEKGPADVAEIPFALPSGPVESGATSSSQNDLRERIDGVNEQIKQMQQGITDAYAEITKLNGKLEKARGETRKTTINDKILGLRNDIRNMEDRIAQLEQDKEIFSVKLSQTMSSPDDVGSMAVEFVSRASDDINRDLRNRAAGGPVEGEAKEEIGDVNDVMEVPKTAERLRGVPTQATVYFASLGLPYKRNREPFIETMTKKNVLSLLSALKIEDPAIKNKALSGTDATKEWLAYVFDNILTKDPRLVTQQRTPYFK